jgi:hypothetical protein
LRGAYTLRQSSQYPSQQVPTSSSQNSPSRLSTPNPTINTIRPGNSHLLRSKHFPNHLSFLWPCIFHRLHGTAREIGLDGPVIRLHFWEAKYGQSRPCSLRSQSCLSSSSDHLGTGDAFCLFALDGVSSVSWNYIR